MRVSSGEGISVLKPRPFPASSLSFCVGAYISRMAPRTSGKKRVDDKLRTPAFLFGCQRLVTRQSQQFLYLLYIRFHRSCCLDGLVLSSGRKSSRRICSMLIVPSLFPGPESAETIVYRQAARNRRKAVIVTRLRCLLVRRRQNSRIRPSARLRLAYPLSSLRAPYVLVLQDGELLDDEPVRIVVRAPVFWSEQEVTRLRSVTLLSLMIIWRAYVVAL